MVDEQKVKRVLANVGLDPAVAAAAAANSAERAFLAVPANSFIDELGATYIAAQTRWQMADEAFADAVPTTPDGALLKLLSLEELEKAMLIGDDSLELRHIRSLIGFMKDWIARQSG